MSSHFNLAKEELSFYGPEETSLQNILAVLIGPKAEASTTGRLASVGISSLVGMSVEELKKFEGIGEAAAKRIASAFGLAQQIRKYNREEGYIIRSPKDAADYFDDLKFHQQEHFEVLYLNTKNVVIARRLIFKGSLNASIVHPREVIREAVRLSSASFVCAHNHPSGVPDPSNEDIEVTKRLVECGKIVGIDLLDHIIIGQGAFVSMKEKGLM